MLAEGDSVIAVVVVNWNGAQDTLACLASVDRQILAPVQVVVVDNGSEDDSVVRITSAHPEVVVISAGRNLGFAEGANLGIEATDAPWVFCLNNDAVLEPETLARLDSAARAAPPDLGMMQPLLLFEDRPDVINSSGVLVFAEGSAVDRDYRLPRAELDVESFAEPFAVTAGAGLYRRAMLDQIRLTSGYFDPNHFMYFEDVDLGWRARLAGWRAELVGEAVALHGFQKSSARQPSYFVEAQCRLNRVRMLLKNASASMVLSFLTSKNPRRDLRWLFKQMGASAMTRYLRAIRDGWRARRQVERLMRTTRRELEQTWFTEAHPKPRELPSQPEP